MIQKFRIWLIKAVARWCGIPIYFEQIRKVVEVKKYFIDRTDLYPLTIEGDYTMEESRQFRDRKHLKEDFMEDAGYKFTKWLQANPDAVRMYEEPPQPHREARQVAFVAKIWAPITERTPNVIDMSTDEKMHRWRHSPMAGQRVPHGKLIVPSEFYDK